MPVPRVAVGEGRDNDAVAAVRADEVHALGGRCRRGAALRPAVRFDVVRCASCRALDSEDQVLSCVCVPDTGAKRSLRTAVFFSASVQVRMCCVKEELLVSIPAASSPAAVWITAVSTCLGRRKPENSCGSRKIAASGTQKNVMRSLRKRWRTFSVGSWGSPHTPYFTTTHARSMCTRPDQKWRDKGQNQVRRKYFAKTAAVAP